MKQRARTITFTMLLLAFATTLISGQAGAKHLLLRTASGGGGVVSAGGYTLVSAIGQHDAGAQGAGNYVVAGGVLVAKPFATPPVGTPDSQIYLPVITR